MENIHPERYRLSLVKIYLIELLVATLWIQCAAPGLSWGSSYPPDIDMGVYHIIGRGMLDGILPYRDLFDHKGPLTYLLYGLGAVLTPHAFYGIGIIYSFILALTLLYAYRIFKLYFSIPISVLLSTCVLFFMGAPATCPDNIGLPCYTIGLFYFLRYWKNPYSKVPWLALGFCVSCLLLLKFNLTAFWIPILLAMFWNELRTKNAAAAFSALWRVSAGVVLPIIPFLIYYSLHENGLMSLWESYVLFCVEYGRGEPVWLVRPAYVLGRFLPVSKHIIPEAFRNEYIVLLLSLISVLSGLLALTVSTFRKKLFPSHAVTGIMALVFSYIFLFLAVFSGRFAFALYYAVFVPFYVLSLVAFAAGLRAMFNDKVVVLMLLGAFSVSFAFYSYRGWVLEKSSVSESPVTEFVKAHQDEALVVYKPGPSCYNLCIYIYSNRNPVVRKFYGAPTADFGFEEGIAQALMQRKAEYLMHVHSAQEPVAPSVEKALRDNYQLIRTIDYDEVIKGPVSIYQRTDKSPV